MRKKVKTNGSTSSHLMCTVGLAMDRVPVNSARQQGKLRSTVDMTPFEQFDLSDLVFSALEWRAALAQSGAARLAQSICRPNFLILPHICTIVSHCGVNVHFVLSHPRHGG